jgi:putative DNA methylase
VSVGRKAIAELVPDPVNRRYHIQIRTGVGETDLRRAEAGTVGRDGKYGEAYLVHQVGGMEYRTKISTLRGDYQRPDGSLGNRLRLWERQDFRPRPDDLLQERLYCIHWMRPKTKGKTYDYEFRSVTPEDLARERLVEKFMAENFADWQARGWVPDMRIEVGGPPRYQGLDLIRARGWTHWHHAFNPRQLLVNGLIARYSCTSTLKFGLCRATNYNSKLSRWHNAPGVDAVNDTFYNQALNTVYNHGCRSSRYIENQIAADLKSYSLEHVRTRVECASALEFAADVDVFVTDPLRRRGEIRGNPRLLHRLATQEPAARVRRLGLGQPPFARHKGRGRGLSEGHG